MVERSRLISQAYARDQAALHATGRYGRMGRLYGQQVEELLRRLGARSILDYGCGSQQSLLKGLQLPEGVVYEGYDPCVEEFSAEPCPAELVVCIDVLEHVEPDLLDNVLDHLASLCDPYGLLTVHVGPADKTLPDGRNAHLTQQGPAWWRPRIESRLVVQRAGPTPGGFFVEVRRR